MISGLVLLSLSFHPNQRYPPKRKERFHKPSYKLPELNKTGCNFYKRTESACCIHTTTRMYSRRSRARVSKRRELPWIIHPPVDCSTLDFLHRQQSSLSTIKAGCVSTCLVGRYMYDLFVKMMPILISGCLWILIDQEIGKMICIRFSSVDCKIFLLSIVQYNADNVNPIFIS